jgi:hypothetical protein
LHCCDTLIQHGAVNRRANHSSSMKFFGHGERFAIRVPEIFL